MSVEILNIDNMEYMKNEPDNSFDLAIVDPPYFDGPGSTGYFGAGYSQIGVKREKDYDETQHWDLPSEEYFRELKRVSKNQIVWGANHLADLFKCGSAGWIVWDKDNGKSTFADAELAYSSFDRALRIFRYRWHGMIQGKIGDKRLNETRIHPTQKPICLYEWLLDNYAEAGQKILDTHLGSGSSAIAAHNRGFEFVGTEIDFNYYSDSVERFEQVTKQQRLDFKDAS